MDAKAKAQTMMRLGEMHCFEEEQRIAIMDMVKDGLMTVDEAFAEVMSVFAVAPRTLVVLTRRSSPRSPSRSI